MDEAVLSRQLYTIGKETQMKMMNTRVLIVGLRGIGSEIAKNVILMSVKAVGLLDNTVGGVREVGQNFYYSEADIGKSLSSATASKFQELNPTVSVNAETRELTNDSIYADYDILVLTNLLGEKESIAVNDNCRKHNVKMVYAVNRGVFSMIFNDFGDDFVVNDTNGENPRSFIISEISDNTIHFVEDDFCNMEVGDEVRFDEIVGMKELNYSENGGRTFKLTKRSGYSVEVGDLSKFTKFVKGGKMTEIKPRVTLHFKSLKERLYEPGEITFSCLTKIERMYLIQQLFHGLMIFKDKFGTFPKSHDTDDCMQFIEILKELKAELNEQSEKIARMFCLMSNGTISPVDTALGGIAAQEVLKAASGKYTPYCQYTVFDCLEVLPDNYLELKKDEFECEESRYSSQIDVIGKTLQKQIEDVKMFLVGAGAIGCEVIKTWAMMGVGRGSGEIFITDNDNIEKSNLSRQFLFRNKHINQPKSKVAKESIQVINPDIRVKDFQLRVGPETENVFDEDFYQNLNCVTTALDNVQARNYVDSQCLLYGLPMIEGGTMGTKGNTLTVVPFVTQSFATGSVHEGAEKSIPMCTLHNFPNNIDHTIQWARDRFEGLFKNDIDQIESYNSDQKKFFENLDKETPNNQLAILESIIDNGSTTAPKDMKDCVKWAFGKYQNYFVDSIQKLITDFPETAVTDEGIPFWHAPKKFPHVIPFNRNEKTCVDFIEAASLLRAECFNIKETMSRDTMCELCEEYLKEKPMSIVKDDEKNLMSAVKQLKETISQLHIHLVRPIVFEKDDDTNHHIAFVTACSNLRAMNYCIQPADFNKTKFISGKIIPAMITTTAVVSGLQCIELYKILLKKPLESYHNSFLNLAIGYLDGTEPERVVKKKLCEGMEVTIWDKFEFDGNCTVKQLCEKISSKYPFDVESITGEDVLLYCAFIPSAHKKLDKTFKQLYLDAKKVEFTGKKMVLALAVSGQKETLPDDFEFPDVILRF
ncbi:ubiquitin-activating enzyme E1, putative [Entamoeba invadens IP1]|uniref:ubiquitin-activating enzyme E1, putative n=1 Tax=Entamoeba invadens IP1 TaxID=370355 RepID=UPI0002C3D1E2|nr:ubiquitin-activating enzyme E1, putative [Entamoeba invadens IP1]ELP85204.1 ubiquitin-activating enzyme E1, putative [Entamoeba invadens IP1]|eukprot:XP_004184550.1 ubiquitin-activating enzyme E1, putative [Entamoeba invadens IP1]